jgi:hypothetical protein
MPKKRAAANDTATIASVEVPLPLPGATEVDAALVDQAVADLNAIYASKGIETARALGEYVVDRFFGGDVDEATGFGPSGERHRSFRALAERDDLHVSHAHLWVSVRVLAQLRQLPDEVASALPLSHHRRLLAIHDEETKVRLAEEAVRNGLTVKALEAEVAHARAQVATGATRGRKPLAGWVKAVNALGRIEFQVEDVTAEMVEGLGEERGAEIVGTIDEAIRALEELRGRILGGRG